MEEHDYDLDDENRFDEIEFDGQPDEAQEWADYMGGDDYYDHSESQWDYGDY